MITNKTVSDLIRGLNQTDETEDLEVKRAAEIGKSLLETVCALSNEPDLGGGTILLGVEKEEQSLFPAFICSGLKSVDKLVTEISTQAATTFNIPIRVSISQEWVGGKCVIRVDVPELPSSSKPLFFKARGLPSGALRRIGSTDQHCTQEDMFVFYHTRSDEAPDQHIIDGVTWDDIDPEAVLAYRRARERVNPLAEELSWSDVELLMSLRCAIGHDPIKITRAGLVSFGKASALRRVDPSNRVDYIRLSGKQWLPEKDVAFDALELRGPTLRTVGRVISAILDDLPRSIRMEEGSPQRVDVPVIPERVIREAVVNAIAHRSYQKFGPVQVIRYSNRLEIRNPGYSLKSQDRFDEPGSTLRNPYIAEVLHETRFAETKGSGVRIMRQKMTEMGLAEPTFISSRDDNTFSAIFLFHHFLSEEDWDWLSRFAEYALDNDQIRALVFVREMGAIDNAAYRHLCQVDVMGASMSLRKLRSYRLLDLRGSGSRTYYVPGEALTAIPGSVSSIPANGGNIPARATNTHAARGGSLANLPASLAVDIERLGKRLHPDAAEALILRICRHQPCSGEEIATVMGRTKDYVTQKYLYQMIKRGSLVYLYPEMMKHPQQKYKTPDLNDQDKP